MLKFVLSVEQYLKTDAFWWVSDDDGGGGGDDDDDDVQFLSFIYCFQVSEAPYLRTYAHWQKLH